jgi:Mg/Co/Ni transporter MgtE
MGSTQELSLLYLSRYPGEAAVSLERSPLEEAIGFMRTISTEDAAQVLIHLSPDKARKLFEGFSAEMQAAILERSPVNNGALLLRNLQSEKRSEILKGLSPERQKQLERLLFYEKGTVGASMDPDPLVFVEDWSVDDCLDRVAEHSSSRPLFHFYVLDRPGYVVGQSNLYDMVRNRGKGISIERVIEPVNFQVSGHTEISTLLSNEGLKRYGSLPVVDGSGLFIGAVYEEQVLEKGGEEGEATSTALGEVFSLGLSGLVQAFSQRNHTD